MAIARAVPVVCCLTAAVLVTETIAAQALDAPTEGEWCCADDAPPARKADTPIDNADPCDVGFLDELPETCSTPRPDVVSANLGFDVGYATMESASARKIGVSYGAIFGDLRFGIAIWDLLVLNTLAGGIAPKDRDSFEESVQECDKYIMYSCSEPYSEESSVSALFVALELGAQYRLRPWRPVSFVPGLLLGQTLGLGNFTRGVGCEDCKSVDLDASASGTYIAPFFRVTIGNRGAVAATLRSIWFLSGDLEQATTLGAEIGLP
jgi:hypothetical protein